MAASDQAVVAVANIAALVATNRDQVSFAVSNVVYFSEDLTQLANNANSIIATNGAGLSDAVSNIEDTTATLKQIADDMRAGKGVAGTILENDEPGDQCPGHGEQPADCHEQFEPAWPLGASCGITRGEPLPRTNGPRSKYIQRRANTRNHDATLGHPHFIFEPVQHGRLCSQPGAP